MCIKKYLVFSKKKLKLKKLYICVCQKICNNNRINMSENKDNLDLEQSNSKLTMGI